VFKFEENPASGAKDPLVFGAFTAPFDFAQGRLEVVPFHDGFILRHYRIPRSTNFTHEPAGRQ
jgi:hypothetical protein